MRSGGVIGVIVILLALLVAVGSWQYGKNLEQQRAQAIAQLISTPEYANCRYDASTCPQSQETVIPTASGAGLAILGIILGLYLLRSDITQRKILAELQTKREQLSLDERKTIIMDILTNDERKIINAVIEQPGISQATLRLRTDMSKAKLSTTLKDLENRGLVKRIEDGKTNEVHLKIKL